MARQKIAPIELKLKLSVSVISLFFFLSSFSQTKAINRVYLSTGLGVKSYFYFGSSIHFFRFLSANYSYGRARIKTGPIYFPNPGFISRGKYIKDTYSYNNFCLGLTTRSMGPLNASLTCGPSFIIYTIHSNIEVYESEYSHVEGVTYESMAGKTVGLVIRGDIMISFNEHVGLNFSILKNYNQVYNNMNFAVGLNFGLVRDRDSD